VSPAPGPVVVDMARALDSYLQRWQAIPADQRAALVAEQAQLRQGRGRS
jgi:hypothetical protein